MFQPLLESTAVSKQVEHAIVPPGACTNLLNRRFRLLTVRQARRKRDHRL